MNIELPERRRALPIAVACLIVFAAQEVHAQPGQLDSGFGNDGALATPIGDESEALRVVAQDDGRIVLGGIVVSDTFEIGVARYLHDGTADPEFGTAGLARTSIGTGVQFADLALQSDGRIVVAATSVGAGGGMFTLVRYRSDGALDTSFGEGGIVQSAIGTSGSAHAVAVQPDGKIVVAGRARAAGGSAMAMAVARFRREGTLDPSFGQGGIVLIDSAGASSANALALQADGGIVLAGRSDTPQDGSRFTLARVDRDGDLDPSFGDGGIVHTIPIVDPVAEAHAVAVQGDGKIVVAGVWGCALLVARYGTSGVPDPSWGETGSISRPVSCEFFRIHDLAITSTGKVVVPGSFDFSVAQFLSDGSHDASFGASGIAAPSGLDAFAAESVALQSDGSIVVAGRADVPRGELSVFGFGVARYQGDASTRSRIELSPDGRRVLVSKDVAGERWAIARNTDDGSVTGNVFRQGQSEPRFIWCGDASPRGARDVLTLSCFGADRCPAEPCARSGWTALPEITLPRAFFEPDVASVWLPVESPVVLPDSFFAPPSAGEPDARDSGIQITRDRASVLISKDVGTQRWAIARSFDDGSVSGNVFDPAGGAPQIVWCSPVQMTTNGASETLSCFLAAERAGE